MSIEYFRMPFDNTLMCSSIATDVRWSRQYLILKLLRSEDLAYNYNFTMPQMEAALTSCSYTAPGYDNISFEILKQVAPSAKSYLLQFYNHP